MLVLQPIKRTLTGWISFESSYPYIRITLDDVSSSFFITEFL